MWFEGYTIWERCWQIHLKALANLFMSDHITLEKGIGTCCRVAAKNQEIRKTARCEDEASK